MRRRSSIAAPRPETPGAGLRLSLGVLAGRMARAASRIPERRVQLIMRTQETDDPTICGPLQPLIGVVESDEEALRIARAHPEDGICWEEIAVRGVREDEELPRIFLLVAGGVFAELAEQDLSPVAAYASREGAERAARLLARRDRPTLLRKVPVGQLDLATPPWAPIPVREMRA